MLLSDDVGWKAGAASVAVLRVEEGAGAAAAMLPQTSIVYLLATGFSGGLRDGVLFGDFVNGWYLLH